MLYLTVSIELLFEELASLLRPCMSIGWLFKKITTHLYKYKHFQYILGMGNFQLVIRTFILGRYCIQFLKFLGLANVPVIVRWAAKNDASSFRFVAAVKGVHWKDFSASPKWVQIQAFPVPEVLEKFIHVFQSPDGYTNYSYRVYIITYSQICGWATLSIPPLCLDELVEQSCKKKALSLLKWKQGRSKCLPFLLKEELFDCICLSENVTVWLPKTKIILIFQNRKRKLWINGL